MKNFFLPQSRTRYIGEAVATATFRVSSLTFLVLFIVEYLEPGFFANWLHPGWILLVAIASSILLILCKAEPKS